MAGGKRTKAPLGHKVNSYNSVEVNDPRLESVWAPRDFEAQLWESLRVWKAEGRKGVWLKLGLGASELVPVAVQAGFKFHHAEEDFVMLTAWVAGAEVANKLPPGPSHFIGVAGLVVNSKSEVLCIREKSGPSARLKDFWKLPGGLVDRHEDLRDAVVREVFEETGLQTTFRQLGTIQEAHHSAAAGPARAGTTDLYCFCVLDAVDENQTLVPQEEEIAECSWVPLNDLLTSRYYSNPDTVYYGMFQAAARLARGEAQGMDAAHLDFGLYPGSNTVYAPGLGSLVKDKKKSVHEVSKL